MVIILQGYNNIFEKPINKRIYDFLKSIKAKKIKIFLTKCLINKF